MTIFFIFFLLNLPLIAKVFRLGLYQELLISKDVTEVRVYLFWILVYSKTQKLNTIGGFSLYRVDPSELKNAKVIHKAVKHRPLTNKEIIKLLREKSPELFL